MQIKVRAKVWDKGLMPSIDPYKIYDAVLLPNGERFRIKINRRSFTMAIKNTGYLTAKGSGEWEIIND